jgi:hypothetical protein
MPGTDYLLLGLNALARAHETNYFGDGHRGAAIVAARYLWRELQLKHGAADPIRALIDEHWAQSPLCDAFPDRPPEPGGVDRIVEALDRNMNGLRQVGHNVIFPSLALKAFRDMPEAATPARVDGVCKLIESFESSDDIHLEDDDERVDLREPSEAAEFILTEMLRAFKAFDGRGQGWSGHLLTYGRALLDLQELGYDALVRKGEHAFSIYIKRIRMGPLPTDKPRPEHARIALRPHQREYWRLRTGRTIALGHVLKYPYGFYGLMGLAGDDDLKRRCMQAAYRIF